jgi:hypothetical protein
VELSHKSVPKPKSKEPWREFVMSLPPGVALPYFGLQLPHANQKEVLFLPLPLLKVDRAERTSGKIFVNLIGYTPPPRSASPLPPPEDDA